MTDFLAFKNANTARWAAMKVDPSREAEILRTAKRLTAPDAKARYQEIEKGTGVPWFVVAVIHEREAGGPPYWDVHIGQGDLLCRKTTHEPAGRGPFFGADAFYRGAVDALMDCPPHTARNTDWSVGGTLLAWLLYNGLGYGSKPSPYLWAGSDQYVSGKYVADHVYDPNAVDKQLGCAPLLKCMMSLDPSIKFGPVRSTVIAPPVASAKPDPWWLKLLKALLGVRS